MKSFRVLFVGIFSVFTCLATAQSISADSALLARCEFTYFYVGQLMQLQNNEGGTKAMLRRSAMMTAANFMMNQENGVIADWKIREFTLSRTPLKRDFDAHTRDPTASAADCDKKAVPIAIRTRDSGKTLWGKGFDELQLTLFNKSRAALGL